MELSDDEASEIATRLLSTDLNLPTIGEAQASLDPLWVRTRSSAVRLQIELSRRTDLVPPNRTWLVTFGFIPVGPSIAGGETASYPKSSSNKFTFGVSVFSQNVGKTPIPAPQRVLGNLDLDGVLFPIILTHSQFTAHSPPAVDATSSKGSCACWVNYSGSAPAPWTKGLFTARHVVEHLSIGASVTLNPTGPSYAGTVADYGACTVDAAVIEVDPADWPGGMSKIAGAGPYSTAMAPGLGVELEGRITTPRATGKIVSHHPLPGYWGSMMGQRIVIDRCGQPGDSGGCVDKAPSGQTIGIYMGEIDDGTGGKHGLAQDLHQACVYLEADVYR